MMEITILSIPVPPYEIAIHKDRWIVQVSRTVDLGASTLRIFKPDRVISVRHRHIILPLEAWEP